MIINAISPTHLKKEIRVYFTKKPTFSRKSRVYLDLADHEGSIDDPFIFWVDVQKGFEILPVYTQNNKLICVLDNSIPSNLSIDEFKEFHITADIIPVNRLKNATSTKNILAIVDKINLHHKKFRKKQIFLQNLHNLSDTFISLIDYELGGIEYLERNLRFQKADEPLNTIEITCDFTISESDLKHVKFPSLDSDIQLTKIKNNFFQIPSEYYSQIDEDGFFKIMSEEALFNPEKIPLNAKRSALISFKNSKHPSLSFLSNMMFFDNIDEAQIVKIKNQECSFEIDFLNLTKEKLTPNQEKIITSIFEKPLTIIEGVAGTGKTKTLVDLSITALKDRKKVLVVTKTHASADNIIHRLINHDLFQPSTEIIRLCGVEAEEKLDRFASEYHIKRVGKKIGETIEKTLTDSILSSEYPEFKILQSRLLEFLNNNPMSMNQILVNNADIVFCVDNNLHGHDFDLNRYSFSLTTSTRSKKELIVLPSFDMIILDDASNLNFPSFILAAQFSKLWVISQDPKQIKPKETMNRIFKERFEQSNLTKLSTDVFQETSLDEIKKARKQRSMKKEEFEIRKSLLFTPANAIIEQRKPSPDLYSKYMLTEQFRMSLDVQTLMKELFPDQFTITDNPAIIDKLPPPLKIKGDQGTLESPLMFYDTRILQENNKESLGFNRSSKNYVEVNSIGDIITTILISEVSSTHSKENPLTIGIESVYRAQTDLIHLKLGLMNELVRDPELTFGFQSKDGKIKIEVRTVHGFEGRQHDVMIFGFTRSTTDIDLGDMDDVSTLFTGMTRVKRMLIILCDTNTFLNRNRVSKPSYQIVKKLKNYKPGNYKVLT